MLSSQHATPEEMRALKLELNASAAQPGGNVISNFHELTDEEDDQTDLNFVESNVFEEAEVAPTQTEA